MPMGGGLPMLYRAGLTGPRSVLAPDASHDAYGNRVTYDPAGRQIAPHVYEPDFERKNQEAEARRAQDPNWIRGKIYQGMLATGLKPNAADMLSWFSEFSPIDDLATAEDAGRAGMAGNYGQAALLGGLSVLGAVGSVPSSKAGRAVMKAGRKVADDAADVGRKAAGKALKRVDNPIHAYHGSPHDFDDFQLEKIGTGEGAQAYGHGLYFAETEDVARNYQRVNAPYEFRGRDLADEMMATQDKMNRLHPSTREFAVLEQKYRVLEDVGTGMRLDDIKSRFDEEDLLPETIDFIASLKSDELSQHRMYEVNLHADPDDFLDWDAPLSEQPEGVRQAVGPLLDTSGGALDKRNAIFADFDAGRIPLEERNARLNQLLPGVSEETPGHGIYARISGTGEPNTDRLQEAGIPGIKYYDAGSRGNVDVNDLRGTVSIWEGAVRKTPGDEYAKSQLAAAKKALADADTGLTRNYVVFDPKIIEIVRKYGIAGALGAGLITQEMAQQMQAQGVEG